MKVVQSGKGQELKLNVTAVNVLNNNLQLGGRFENLPSFLKMVDPLTGNKRSAPRAESIFSDRWLGLKTSASQSTVPYQLT